MKANLSKQQYIEQLSKLLPEDAESQLLIDDAKKLIPSENDQRQLTALNNSRYVHRAVSAYLQLNPGSNKPSIETLIEWLLNMGAVSYAGILEKKLAQINEIVMAVGIISPEDKVTLMGEDLIVLRVLSRSDLIFTKPLKKGSEFSSDR